MSSKKDFLRDARIWDFVARNACDEIAAGGWKNSYDGNLFSVEEMREYADDVYLKLQRHLDKTKTCVLEVGCASGITMYRIAPYVKRYIGTDMAKENLKKNEKRNIEHKITNIELEQCRADEILKFKDEHINIIIINSVIQYFGTEEYLLDIIKKAATLIENDGILYIGDVRDAELKAHYEQSVIDYYSLHQMDLRGIRTSDELFVKRDFFTELKDQYPFVKQVLITEKLGSIENELTKYRYDVLINIEK